MVRTISAAPASRVLDRKFVGQTNDSWAAICRLPMSKSLGLRRELIRRRLGPSLAGSSAVFGPANGAAADWLGPVAKTNSSH